jgi:nucleoid-associated protein YgaU
MALFESETVGWLTRPLLVVGVGMLAVVVAIGLNLVLTDHRSPTPKEEATATTSATSPSATSPSATSPSATAPNANNSATTSATPAAPAAPEAAAKAAEPSFDVVRVEPSGAAVIAGRAPPGSRVVVKNGEQAMGEMKADQRGEWVLVPAQPLAPGTHELTVEVQRPDGTVTTGDDLVVVVVPPPATAGGQPSGGPLAVKTSRRTGAPSVVLQSGVGQGQQGPLAIETIDGRGDGRVAIGGHAPPQARLRVYLDNGFLGETTADHLGLWLLKPKAPLPPGEHALRADQVAAGGEVVARAEVPLHLPTGGGLSARASVPEHVPERIVVERGQSLWRIARAIYGQGLEYTVIYDANRHQIVDPDLIYPGQVFQIPPPQ